MSTINRELLANRYSLLDNPRTGGTATVYRARDLETDQLVAIKRFDRDRLLPEIEAEAYRREVEALRNLIHPNILLIHDTGDDSQGRPFLVLEWMAHDLVDYRARGASAFNGWDDFAEQVASPLAEALAHAHANGYCHRDVKPGNVLLSDSGVVKLADFGVSKLKRCLQPRITLSEFVSRPYAPPEPDDGAFTYSRDVFAFGVLCVWALSARPVNDYSDLSPALGELDVIKDVRELLDRCLSSDPKSRLQTAGVLSHELAKIQARRRQVWAAQDRKRCRAKLTQRAGKIIAEHIGNGDEAAVHRFVEVDLNEEPTVARFYSGIGTPVEKLVPDHYFVYGSQFCYQLALNSGGPGLGEFAILSARHFEPHRMQKFKEGGLLCPLGISLSSGPGQFPVKEAVKLLERLLAEFEDAKKAEAGKVAEDSLFGTWKRVLDAHSTYEREKVAPIKFNRAEVKGILSPCIRKESYRASNLNSRESSKLIDFVFPAKYTKWPLTALS